MRSAVKKIELLMNDLGITPEDRQVVVAARAKAEETGGSCSCPRIAKWSNRTGKNSELLIQLPALINAIKTSAGIDKDTKLIEPEVVKPIQGLKIDHLGSRNPRLHSNEILSPWPLQLPTMRMCMPWRNLVTSKVLKLTNNHPY
ncbi:MAG: hypothetical protein ACLTZB_05915 [Streptococcus salivarius]